MLRQDCVIPQLLLGDLKGLFIRIVGSFYIQ